MNLRKIIREELQRYIVEATPGEEAKKRGLQSIGFGRYADPSDPQTVVAKSVNGRLVAVKPGEDEPKKDRSQGEDPPAKRKTADVILGKQTGGPAGSNEGGFYKGTDGVPRYVKFYRNPDQGKSEHLANNIYKALGIGSPNSHLFEADGREAFASDIVDGDILQKRGLDKEIANKILDGLAADVLLANWDVVGLVNDNILVTSDGNPVRIDNGSTFAFRAQGGEKPSHLQTDITELDGFSNPNINPEYTRVFRAAGYQNVEDMGEKFTEQVTDIAALYIRLGKDWSKLIRKIVPSWDDEQVQHAARMLDARTKKLIQVALDMENNNKEEKDDKGAQEWTKDSESGGELNGVPFKSWDAPKSIEEWAQVDGTNPSIKEPPFESGGKRKSAGVIIEEPDGRIWIVEPTNHFGGYKHTFPKGGIEDGLDPQRSAIKEAYEEAGLQVAIKGFFGDFDGDTSVTRYYKAQRVGGTPTDHGWESQAVKLIPRNELRQYLNRERDQKISQEL